MLITDCCLASQQLSAPYVCVPGVCEQVKIALWALRGIVMIR